MKAAHLKVEWSLKADGMLSIIWTESGGRPTKPPSGRGVGTLVVQEIVKGELNGQAHLDWRADGLICTHFGARCRTMIIAVAGERYPADALVSQISTLQQNRLD